MTIHQLSAACVKVQVTAEEYNTHAGSRQGMLCLIARMLSEAERISRIPFTRLPVAAELLAMPDGGISAYFSVRRSPRTCWLAARFPDAGTVRVCCRLIAPHLPQILHSMLYRGRAGYVLTLKMPRASSAAVRHILGEYGTPFRLTQITRARLTEYAVLLHAEQAVQNVIRNAE